MRTAPLAFALLLIACGTTQVEHVQQPGAPERTEQQVTITSGTPVTMADISIDGMSCEMMCGGAIKKALAKLPGVNATEIKFVEGDATDHAIVTYDPAKVSDADMVKAIQQLHDGQYKVLAVSVTKQVMDKTGEGEGTEEKGGDKVSASIHRVLLPSIFEMLAQIVRL